MCVIYLFIFNHVFIPGIWYFLYHFSCTNGSLLFMSAPDILNTFKGLYAQKACPSRESNPGRWINRQTLYHVAVKAGFYCKAVEVYHIPIPCDKPHRDLNSNRIIINLDLFSFQNKITQSYEGTCKLSINQSLVFKIH